MEIDSIHLSRITELEMVVMGVLRSETIESSDILTGISDGLGDG